MDTHMEPMVLTMERDLLMLSQRLMLSTDTTDMEIHTDTMVDTEPTDTHTDTTERDLLMLSQRLRLMLLFCTELMDMVVLDMPVLDMLDMDMDTHMLMVDMDTHMPMVSME